MEWPQGKYSLFLKREKLIQPQQREQLTQGPGSQQHPWQETVFGANTMADDRSNGSFLFPSPPKQALDRWTQSPTSSPPLRPPMSRTLRQGPLDTSSRTAGHFVKDWTLRQGLDTSSRISGHNDKDWTLRQGFPGTMTRSGRNVRNRA